MVIQLVAEPDVKLDLQTKDGDSALIKACLNNPNIDYVRTLVQNKANMNVKNAHDNTALHFAVEYKNLEIVTYLLEQGADPDIQNTTNGDTPLILAADNGDEEMVKVFIRNGADVNIINKQLHTAYSVTDEASIKQLLVDAGATILN